ncbi:hypothetical protein K8O92_33490 (plasmid) [Nocardia asteroides]|nr:hypothetical protein K8O92_33490 [Nocardia asteroides]
MAGSGITASSVLLPPAASITLVVGILVITALVLVPAAWRATFAATPAKRRDALAVVKALMRVDLPPEEPKQQLGERAGESPRANPDDPN